MDQSRNFGIFSSSADHALNLLIQLVAGLLGVESGQDAVIRALLYERKAQIVVPYGVSVAEFTNHISALRNRLGKGGLKDEELVVPRAIGAEGRISGNVLAGDNNSLSYGRTPEEILRIVYAGGNERVPGGFYPHGANGCIARSYKVPELNPCLMIITTLYLHSVLPFTSSI